MSNTNVVRTAVASLMQTSHYTGKQASVIPNSTLNQKLAVAENVLPADTDKLSVAYVGIGNGGHGFITGGNNKVKWQSYHHDATDTGMYNQLPFILRRPDNDLTPTERAKYRIRRLETHGGQQYIAYYLRVLDLTNTVPILEKRHVENGITTSTPYSPTLEDLNPTPPTLTTGNAVTTTGDYIAATAKVVFEMTADDVAEFVEACKIIEGEEGYAVISELTTISGVDKVVQGVFNGATQSYNEAIYAQITSFVATAWVMEYQTDGVSIALDIGSVEPIGISG